MKVLISVRLNMKYDKGSFSFSKFDLAATDEQLLTFANAVNSVQSKTPEKITRTEVFYLDF